MNPINVREHHGKPWKMNFSAIYHHKVGRASIQACAQAQMQNILAVAYK
jgi:hypothetical protein